jgi:hypothetical protein
MIAHIYPSVLQAESGRDYAGCLDECFQGYWGEAMQDLGYELPRIHIPRTRVNKASKTVSEEYMEPTRGSETLARKGASADERASPKGREQKHP